MSKNTINVILHGELGNQMFEVATGISLAHDLNFQLRGECVNNPNRLKKFKINEVIEITDKPKTMKKNFSDIIYGLNTRINQKFLKHALSALILIYTNLRKIHRKFIWIKDNKDENFNEKIIHSYNPDIYKISEDTTLSGYFQSWKYFHHNKNLIKQAFELKSMSADTAEIFSRLPKKFTALHVRRGNTGAAILAQNYHGLLPMDYYLNAYNLLKSLHCDFPIVVFTDNKQECEKFLVMQQELPIEMIIGPEDVTDQSENLNLMQSASSIIGANSSYSWWAAYLNFNDSITAIFPRPWYREPGEPEQELLLPNWLTVGFQNFIEEVK